MSELEPCGDTKCGCVVPGAHYDNRSLHKTKIKIDNEHLDAALGSATDRCAKIGCLGQQGLKELLYPEHKVWSDLGLANLAGDRAPLEQGRRDNAGKVRYDLLPEKSLHELACVYTMGSEKYADRNWEKGLSWMGCIASLRRHIACWVMGEQIDPESGLHHMAHAAFNCLALVEFYYTKRGEDDRVKYAQVP